MNTHDFDELENLQIHLGMENSFYVFLVRNICNSFEFMIFTSITGTTRPINVHTYWHHFSYGMHECKTLRCEL